MHDSNAGASAQSVRPLLEPELAKAVREVALEAAERMHDISRLDDAINRPDNVEPVYQSSMWAPGSLSHGLAGTALMFALMSTTDPGFQRLAHEHLSRAVADLQWNSYAGLMGGPSAALAAAQGVTGKGENDRPLRQKLGQWVAQRQIEHTDAYERSSSPGVAWHAYDFINGLSGTLRVLMDEESPITREAVLRTGRFFSRRILSRQETGFPGWWVPAALQPTPQDKEMYPFGDLNLGLAHGVSGTVAALVSLVENEGPSDDLLEALSFATDWIRRWKQEANEISYWPARVPAQYDREPDRTPSHFSRAAWCYGTPGVALTLARASRVLDAKDLEVEALDTLISHLGVPWREWKLDGPTFCHGNSGTLQVISRMWQLTGDERLLQPANEIAAMIIRDQTSPHSPLLFQHWVPDSPAGWRKATGHRRLDSAELLEGAAGVAATLYDAGAEAPITGASWRRDRYPDRAW
ncbi:lanthionine synthetase C family protein [Auritidibacter ignavus]|uniref:Lanthionine synthetase C family protein n=1 Tax=Auritidibacter ignavus TaxID=678932 RepID=A0AAJ6DBP2_9MICC|nr:lanthionine synthetase C family protein [Auritidibacter ignavus]WGH92296.1 lanthionine synthetase C family protein [Auritidibacter ignavus]